MRSFRIAALTGTFVMSLWISAASAQSDVLLPPTSANSQPNLGLVPRSTLSTGPSTTAPSTTAPSTTAASTTSQSTPPLPNTQAPAASASPAPAYASVTPPPAPTTNTPTQVIKIPRADADTMAKIGENLPNTLAIDVEKKWRDSDIKHVSDMLGISAEQVPALCNISVGGVVQTDKAPSMFDTGDNAHGAAKYAGKIVSLMGTIRAICDASTPLPPNKGAVLELGDKYMVPIGGANCRRADNSPEPVQATITRPANGLIECQFH